MKVGKRLFSTVEREEVVLEPRLGAIIKAYTFVMVSLGFNC